MHDMSNTRKEIAARLGFAARFGRDYPSKVSETAGASGGTWSKKMARYGSKKAAVMTYTDGGQVGQVYQDPDNPRVFKAFDMGGRLLGEGSEMDMKRKVEAINASRPGAKESFGRAEDVYRLLETTPGSYANYKKRDALVTEAMRLADITPAGKDVSLHELAEMVGQDLEADRSRMSRPGAKAEFAGDIETKLRSLISRFGFKPDKISVSDRFGVAHVEFIDQKGKATEMVSKLKGAMKQMGVPESAIKARENQYPADQDGPAQHIGMVTIDFGQMKASRPGAKTRMTREQTEEQKAGLKIMSAADPAVGAKIATLIKEGKPQDQAVAIALDMKRRGEL